MENYTDSDYDSELEDMLDSDYYPSDSDDESDMSVTSESDLDSEDGYIEDWNDINKKFEARRKIFEELFEPNEGPALPNLIDFEIDVDMPESPKKDLKRKREDE